MKTIYVPVKDEVELFENCFRQRLPLLLKGPTGCGKSQFVQHMAEKLGLPLIKVACNEDTSSADLLGRFLIRGADTVWQDGPVSRAVRLGALLYLDEIAEAREDVIVALHPLTDHRREIYLDRVNETLAAPSSFMCVASFNPGYQSGLKELKPSTRQRFVHLSLDYLDSQREAQLLVELTGIKADLAAKLVLLAERIRKSSHLVLKETVSTRLLVHTAQLCLSGIQPRRAAHVGIAEVLTDDLETVKSLKELANLVI